MKRARISQSLLVALLASASAGAAPPAQIRGGAASAALSGIYSIAFSVNVGSALPPGSTILCNAKAVPNVGGFENFALRAVPVASGQARLVSSGTVGAPGSWANCTVQVPFSWVASDTRGAAVLSYEIDAVNESGTAVTIGKKGGIRLGYPVSGGTTSLNFSVRF
jgi:hypothetical protein